jgi:hypothetical protein
MLAGCTTGIDSVKHGDATISQGCQWPLPANQHGNQVGITAIDIADVN